MTSDRERADRVRAAVAAEWRTAVTRRRTRRRVIASLATLSVAALLLLTVRVVSSPEQPAIEVTVATVERVEGDLSRDGARSQTSVAVGETVAIGEWIESRAAGRAGLRTVDQTSVRLDVGTRLRWTAPTIIELQRGALYIDTAEEARPLEIRTAYGSAVDVGTQFEVRLQPGALRVRVRAGAVAVKRRGDTFDASAGTELTVTDRGADTRPLNASGAAWEWPMRVAPPFRFEGSTLADYLAYLAREQAWAIEYQDARARRQAQSAVLHGSVDGLAIHDAVSVAVAAAGLSHRFENGRVIVSHVDAAEGTSR